MDEFKSNLDSYRNHVAEALNDIRGSLDKLSAVYMDMEHTDPSTDIANLQVVIETFIDEAYQAVGKALLAGGDALRVAYESDDKRREHKELFKAIRASVDHLERAKYPVDRTKEDISKSLHDIATGAETFYMRDNIRSYRCLCDTKKHSKAHREWVDSLTPSDE